ncbi:PREDICTED: uncharacterized protein LOC105361456 [Ceratosolen solmsi marchali]|uniref:Uncharacterized protein LOC105361456 n=1 Tax=Ceratosolen solmsi marchali TaxID=326594 RepID=A0AAJ6YF60_9HYME|nr:PREDICTED: uncharacterized protein LOC105361456 [Ceratosolen solmsi marchali]
MHDYVGDLTQLENMWGVTEFATGIPVHQNERTNTHTESTEMTNGSSSFAVSIAPSISLASGIEMSSVTEASSSEGFEVIESPDSIQAISTSVEARGNRSANITESSESNC